MTRSGRALIFDLDGTLVAHRGRGDPTPPRRDLPEPDLFLACAERLGVTASDSYVIGDAVWDLLSARRAGMLGIGVSSGG